jgi:hypothetical protein
MLKKALLGLGAFLVVAILISFLLPSKSTVYRTATIAAPQQAVMAQVVNFRNWKSWSPWAKQDPTSVMNYSATDGQVGSWYTWEGKKLGQGKMTATYLAPDSMNSDLIFDGSGGTTSGFKFTTVNGGTQVLWTLHSDLGYNPMMRYMGLFFDNLIGPDYESGLANLKQVVEAEAK